jgi:hypothetical protein
VAWRLLALLARDPRGARLAARARTTGVVAADVDRVLTQGRSLVVSWLNRGTLRRNAPILAAGCAVSGYRRRARRPGGPQSQIRQLSQPQDKEVRLRSASYAPDLAELLEDAWRLRAPKPC